MIAYKVLRLQPDGQLISATTLGMEVTYNKYRPTVRDKTIQGPFACFTTLKEARAFANFCSSPSSPILMLYKCRIVKSKVQRLYYMDYSIFDQGEQVVSTTLLRDTVLADKVTLLEPLYRYSSFSLRPGDCEGYKIDSHREEAY